MMIWLIRYLVVINAFSFFLFGFDKLSAGQQWRRVSERALYVVTLLGGSIGSLLGMYAFRHKTRKSSFQIMIALVILTQIALFVLLARTQFFPYG